MHRVTLGHFSSELSFITRGKFWIESETNLNNPESEPRVMMSAYKGDTMTPAILEVDMQASCLRWSDGSECKVANVYEIIEHARNLMTSVDETSEYKLN